MISLGTRYSSRSLPTQTTLWFHARCFQDPRPCLALGEGHKAPAPGCRPGGGRGSGAGASEVPQPLKVSAAGADHSPARALPPLPSSTSSRAHQCLQLPQSSLPCGHPARPGPAWAPCPSWLSLHSPEGIWRGCQAMAQLHPRLWKEYGLGSLLWGDRARRGSSSSPSSV